MTMHGYVTVPRDAGELLKLLRAAVDRAPCCCGPLIAGLSLGSGLLLSATAVADRALLEPSLDRKPFERLADTAARALCLTTRAIRELEDGHRVRGDEVIAQALTLVVFTL